MPRGDLGFTSSCGFLAGGKGGPAGAGRVSARDIVMDGSTSSDHLCFLRFSLYLDNNKVITLKSFLENKYLGSD